MSRRPSDWIIREMWPDAPDWIIRGRARRSGHNLQDWIIRGTLARRPGLDHPGLNPKEQP